MAPWAVARRANAPAAPVVWREGVYLTGTPIWCDARRRRDVCFASAADRIAAVGHGQLIATPTTLALAGAEASGGHLGVPLQRPFTLGAVRLELIASGRTWGAASLHVDVRGRTVLYAGPIRASDPPAGERAADVRACDALVVAAPAFEELEPRAAVAARLFDWVRARRTAGETPVLVVDAPLEGVELAQELARASVVPAGELAVTRAIARAHELLPQDVRDAAGLAEPNATLRGAAVIVRLERDRLPSLASAPAALVSPRAEHPYQDAFAWPFTAGRGELLAWIEQTRARDIYVTGAAAEAVAVALGPRAQRLGPPQQMSLFEAAR